MDCEECGKPIIGNPWIWDVKELCEDCFVEIAAEEYNRGYNDMIEEQKKVRPLKLVDLNKKPVKKEIQRCL